MPPFRLMDRQFGSEFCKLERSLIFDPEMKDVGFVHFLTGNTIVLKGSKFTQMDKDRVYVLPVEISKEIVEGQFVKVETGKIERAVIPSGAGRGALKNASYKEVTEAISIEDARIPLPPPSLPADEFLYRASSNWNSAEEDLLDKIIALLMVSAPSSVYGHGGIGSEGLEVMRSPGTGTPRDVAQTIYSQLPVEFRIKGKSPYRYSTVDSLKGLIEFERGRAPENSYSILKPMRYSERLKEKRVPIQLPFVLKDSELSGKKEDLDLDVLEYQLTALYTPPPSENMVKKVAADLARTSHGESIWGGKAISAIDPLSSLRIGLSLSRLNVGKHFDGKGYSRRITDIGDGRDLFRELISRGLEEVERRARREKMVDSMGVHPWRDGLRPIDREVYFELRTRSEETGVDEFKVDDIDIELDGRTLEVSLDRLNRYGYILYLKGKTVIKLIIDSSPEDSS